MNISQFFEKLSLAINGLRDGNKKTNLQMCLVATMVLFVLSFIWGAIDRETNAED